MIWRKGIVALLIIGILLSGTLQVSAWRAAKTKWVIGDIVYGNEVVLQKPSQTMFHSQTLAASDTEALAISFPAATTGGIAAVNAAGPSIAQTSNAAILGAETGYYTANWCFNCFSNNGGWAVGDMGAMSPVRSGPLLGAGLIWPYMNTPNPDAGYTKLSFKPYINSSSDIGNVAISPNSNMVNNTQANTSSPVVGVSNNSTAGQSKTPLNYKTATKEQIKNTSALEKMWRNANLVNTVPQSYKGAVERPTEISAGKKVIKMTDRNKAITDSLNMTKPDAEAHTLFWDL